MNDSRRNAAWIGGALTALLIAGIVGCGPASTTTATAATSSASAKVLPRAKPTARPVIAAVGDIACPTNFAVTPTACQHQAVADAITKLKPDSVWLLGDIQYLYGELDQFRASFGKAFAPLQNRWRPTPGNHEYGTTGAAGYFDFFGKAAGPGRRGYYSFNIGSWHVVSLNANCRLVDCGPNSVQANWLRADLKKYKRRCTAAIWHQPLFSSGKEHGNNPAMASLWTILQNRKADVVLSGHDHDIEVFGRQDALGNRDPKGMIEIVSGAGGKSFYDFGTIRANSKLRIGDKFGFVKLRLNPTSFDWTIVDKDSNALARSSARCI